MRAEKRLWRTEDGELVLEGAPKAALLAYGEDDEIESDDEAAVKKLSKSDDKKSPAPRDKKSPAPSNKSK